MSKWPVERRLTLRCCAVLLCCLSAFAFWPGSVPAGWPHAAFVLLATLAGGALFRLLIASDARRMTDLVNVARRLSRSDVSARVGWAGAAAAGEDDPAMAARVAQLTQEFAACFREGFHRDVEATSLVGKLRVPVLRCGKTVLNLDEARVDKFGTHGTTATIFVARGADFVRISTSVRKPDGSRAIGTLLDRTSPAYEALAGGGVFSGKARLFGVDYVTRYIPVSAGAGEVIGALFVGVAAERSAAAGDQVTALGCELNALAEEVSRFVQSISRSGDAVVDSTISLADNMATIVDSSGRQSEFAQSVGASIEQMSVTIDHVAEHARQTESIALSSRQLSESGVKAVDDAAREIAEIADCVHLLSQVVSALDERSADINGIVGAIRDISDQTNVLALNAAIEAARAGEQGRGFAIVAGEVRRLAGQTGEATGRITTLIEQIRQQIEDAVRKMEAGNVHVETGVRLAGIAKESLADIKQGTDSTVGKVQEITSATREQAGASKEIARNFEAIAQKAEQEAESIAEISAAASSLEQMSAQLYSMIHRFKY